MSHQAYHEWFLVHSGKKPQSFLSGLKSKIDSTVADSSKKVPQKEKPKEKKEKGETNYERWFYRNCDNNNEPDLNEIKSHDYDAWFQRHSMKRIRSPLECDKSYAAWFERNRDNRNPGKYTPSPMTYEQWFCKHRTPSEPVKTTCVKHESYEAWFNRHH